jgi:hypothetical protein
MELIEPTTEDDPSLDSEYMSHAKEHFSEVRIRKIIKEYLESEWTPGQRPTPRGRGFEALLDDLALQVEETMNSEELSLGDAVETVLRKEDLYNDSNVKGWLGAKLKNRGMTEMISKNRLKRIIKEAIVAEARPTNYDQLPYDMGGPWVDKDAPVGKGAKEYDDLDRELTDEEIEASMGWDPGPPDETLEISPADGVALQKAGYKVGALVRSIDFVGDQRGGDFKKVVGKEIGTVVDVDDSEDGPIQFVVNWSTGTPTMVSSDELELVEGVNMKITRAQLRKLIMEIGSPPDMDAPGWGPNDTEDWERQASYEEREGIEAEKKAFMAKELTHWYDEFDPEDDGQADLIEDHVSECYDAIYKDLIDPYGA